MFLSAVNYREREKMDSRGGTPRTKDGFYETDSGGGEWVVPNRYQDLQPLGIGTFGTVW